MIVLAVDPGLANGLAVLNLHADLLFATEIEPIGEGARKRLPLASLVDLIEQYGVTHAVVEDVSAMPGQGVSSSFRLAALQDPSKVSFPLLKFRPRSFAPLSGRNL